MKRGLLLALLLVPLAQSNFIDDTLATLPQCTTSVQQIQCMDGSMYLQCTPQTDVVARCTIAFGNDSATVDGVDPAALDLAGLAAQVVEHSMGTQQRLEQYGIDVAGWVSDEAAAYTGFVFDRADAFCDALIASWQDCDGAVEEAWRWAGHDWHGEIQYHATKFNEYVLVPVERLVGFNGTLILFEMQTHGMPGHVEVDDEEQCGDYSGGLLNQFSDDRPCHHRAMLSTGASLECSVLIEIVNRSHACPGEWSRDWRETVGVFGASATPGSIPGLAPLWRAHLGWDDGAWVIESPVGVYTCRGEEMAFWARGVTAESRVFFEAWEWWLGHYFPWGVVYAAQDDASQPTATGWCDVIGDVGSYVVDIRGAGSLGRVSAGGTFPCHVDDRSDEAGAAISTSWDQQQPAPHGRIDGMAIISYELNPLINGPCWTTPWGDALGGGDDS